MNAPVDTLAFAERFEEAGFGHDQARVLAAAFGQARESGREDLATKADLDLRLAELESRLAKQFGDLEGRLAKQLGDMEVRMTRHAGEVGKDATGRLWSAVTIIGGVSTAVAAAISAGVAILLKSGSL